MSSNTSLVIIKIGSTSIANRDGTIDIDAIKTITTGIAKLRFLNYKVILVSSGAVACGKFKNLKKHRLNINNQVYSAIGQPRLFGLYQENFQHQGLLAAQVLITREDLRSRQKYLNIRNALEAMLEEDIVPIINENDTVSVDGLMFTDNDELATTIAIQLSADHLIMITESGGVFDGDPSKPESKIISEINDLESIKFLDDPKFKSNLGRGGIWSKINCCFKAATLGTNSCITALTSPDIFVNTIEKLSKGSFFPAHKKLKSKKAWMAQNLEKVSGSVYLTNEALPYFLKKDGQARSLLPIGIQRVEGNFEAGDFINIKDQDDSIIGNGVTEYESSLVLEYLGQKNKDALVHYDNLLIHD